MKLVADSAGRLCAKGLFTPRKVFDATVQPDGSIRLVELVEKPLPTVQLIKRDGLTLLSNGRKLTLEDCQRALEDFP